jgi:hypothetical protein
MLLLSTVEVIAKRVFDLNALGFLFWPIFSQTRIWDRCYDFLNIFAEKFSEKIGVLLKLLLVFAKIVIITLVFEKNANLTHRAFMYGKPTASRFTY